MNARLLLGIDAGLSMTKAALFDRSGHEIAAAGVAGKVLHPRPGWTERPMEEAWSSAARAIQNVLVKAAIDADDVAAVGVSGAMVGVWPIDERGTPVRDAILVADSRGQEVIDRLLADDPNAMARVFASDGCVVEPGCTLPLLRWLLDHEPEPMARAKHILTCKDWLRYRLTGEIFADPTEAAVAPGDARRRGRSTDMLRLFGLAGGGDLLPPVKPSESIGGVVTDTAATETGLRQGTPVAVGAGDVPCSALASGAVEAGDACTILGTTCHNGILFDKPVFQPENLGLLFTLPADLWFRVMVNLAGTPNLDWILTQVFSDVTAKLTGPALYEHMEAIADARPRGVGGLLYHPYLTDVGLIAPQVSTGARAQFAGLNPGHTRADLLRAVYEGVAYAIRDCYEAIGHLIGEIHLVGGGARSAFWSQLVADVTGVPVIVPEGTEFGAKGAALLAGTALGWYPSVGEAARTATAVRRRFLPDPKAKPIYSEAFARYQAARRAIVQLATHT